MAENPAVSPFVAQLLRGEPLSAAVKTSGVTADADGYFYKAGAIVAIEGDATVRKCGTSDKAFGILEDSLSDMTGRGIKVALDANSRVSVIPFRFGRAIVRALAEGALEAGDEVVASTVTAGQFKKATALSIATGATPVTSGAANGTGIVIGGSMTEKVCGIVWVGAATGKEAQILI